MITYPELSSDSGNMTMTKSKLQSNPFRVLASVSSQGSKSTQTNTNDARSQSVHSGRRTAAAEAGSEVRRDDKWSNAGSGRSTSVCRSAAEDGSEVHRGGNTHDRLSNAADDFNVASGMDFGDTACENCRNIADDGSGDSENSNVGSGTVSENSLASLKRLHQYVTEGDADDGSENAANDGSENSRRYRTAAPTTVAPSDDGRPLIKSSSHTPVDVSVNDRDRGLYHSLN